jgi:hypothetical protein
MGLVFLAIVPVGCLWVALGPTRLIRGALPQGISNFVMGARVVYGLVAGGFIFLFVSVGFGPEHYESIGPTALACFTFLLLSIVGGQAIDHRRSFHACRDCAMTIKRAARVCPYCGYRYEAPLKGSRGSASPDSGDAGPAH